MRDAPLGVRKLLPKSEWQFARHRLAGKIVPDARYVYLKSGFEPGKIYEVVYQAKDPVVVGLGLAAVRDLASYFKRNPASIAPARRAYVILTRIFGLSRAFGDAIFGCSLL